MARYQQLVEFKREYGHCKVPRRYTQSKNDDKNGDGSLGNWVSVQRRHFKRGDLPSKRKEMLNDNEVIFPTIAKKCWMTSAFRGMGIKIIG